MLNMPQAVQTFGDDVVKANPSAGVSWSPHLCTTFTSSIVTSPSTLYEHSVQPIFNGKCVGCHFGGLNAAGHPPLDLTEGHSFTALHLKVQGTVAYDVMLQQVTTNQMPQNCNPTPAPPGSYYTCLTPADIGLLQQWVNFGAN
jgi:hypothetical protein